MNLYFAHAHWKKSTNVLATIGLYVISGGVGTLIFYYWPQIQLYLPTNEMGEFFGALILVTAHSLTYLVMETMINFTIKKFKNRRK